MAESFLQNKRESILSDEELACQVQAGSHADFTELVNRYSVRLYHFLRHRTYNSQDAEDLVQETFIKSYIHIKKYRSKYKFSTWLFTIAVRLAISHNRKKRVAAVESAGEYIQEYPGPGPAEILTQNEERQNFWILARSLSNNQHDVLWFHYVENMPIKEIAQVMNKTQVHVKVLLHRARLNLAKRFTNAGDGVNVSTPPTAKEVTPQNNYKFSAKMVKEK